ncbi:Ig-like domain-containing protein, partial [Methylocucumis oryzae]
VVNPVNHAPTASNDTGIGLEDDVQTGNVLANDRDPDGDELTVTGFTIDGEAYNPGDSATIPGIGTFSLSADGQYSFTPEPDYHGPVPEITVTVSDGEFSTTSTLTLSVTPVTDITDDNVTLNQDSTITIDVLDNDSFEGSPVITNVTTPSHGTVTINADGTLTYTPNPGYVGSDSFIYTVESPEGTLETATVTITVNEVDIPNNPPLAENDSNEPIEEGSAATGNLLGNDSDPDGDTISITQYSIEGMSGTFKAGDIVTIPNVGVIVINADGSYLFTPFDNFVGEVPTITYTISDGKGGESTAELTLSVAPAQPFSPDNLWNAGDLSLLNKFVFPHLIEVENEIIRILPLLKVVTEINDLDSISNLEASVFYPIMKEVQRIAQLKFFVERLDEMLTEYLENYGNEDTEFDRAEIAYIQTWLGQLDNDAQLMMQRFNSVSGRFNEWLEYLYGQMQHRSQKLKNTDMVV